MEEFGGGIAGNGGGIVMLPRSSPFSTNAPLVSVARTPVKGVRGSAPPPFLTKTFKMVEDPATNHLICWNSCGTSFIILDHLNLASEILPKYFRHSNFSSFIYQLNNYGFKKIGLRQFEYENQWFLAGQEHLLKNIRRRRSAEDSTPRKQPPSLRRPCLVAEDYGIEGDMEKIRCNISSFKVEYPKLKRQVNHLENRVATFQQNVKEMDGKSNEMITFLGRVLSPSVVDKMIRRLEEEQELECHEMLKIWRSGNCSDDDKGKKNQADDGSGSKGDSISDKNEPKEYDPFKVWEKIVGDDSTSEDEEEYEQELARKSSRFEMGLDDMMVSKIGMGVEHMDDEVTFGLWT